MPALFRRRQVWLPTFLGALLACALVAALAVAGALLIGPFLAQSDPAHGPDGHGARTLVVEGWLDEAGLDEAIAAFRRGRYERIVTSGGPIEGWQEGTVWPTYAERAASYLRRHGAGDATVVIAAPAPPTALERTYLSAVAVRQLARREGLVLDAFDLFSGDVHARRSRLDYRLAFGPRVEVGVLAATARHYDLAHWWRSSEGAKTVLGEALGLAWTGCCFWPAAPPADDEARPAVRPAA
ncbi:MAG: hypothetical protein ABI364_06890 [Caldimonas sp.]